MRWPARWRRRAPEAEAAGVIVHYHIYKNAGSSIDRLLSECFGRGWQAFDPTPGTNPAQRADLAAFIAANPDLRAVSSHSTRLAWPGLPHPHACPVVMLRHPIDRVRSVYEFARRDVSQPDHAAAVQGTFQAYVEHRLSRDDRSVISNYQVAHLSQAALRSIHPWLANPAMPDLEQARSLLFSWPAFGLVRRFEDSMAWFETVYLDRVPGLVLREIHENRTSSLADSEEAAIESVATDLGPDTLSSLVAANLLDLALYEFAKVRFDTQARASKEQPTRDWRRSG